MSHLSHWRGWQLASALFDSDGSLSGLLLTNGNCQIAYSLLYFAIIVFSPFRIFKDPFQLK